MKPGVPVLSLIPLQPAYVLQIFPPCEFSESHLSRLAPDLLASISNISPHLMIVIASVWATEWSPLSVFSWGSAAKNHTQENPATWRKKLPKGTDSTARRPASPSCPPARLSRTDPSGQWCCYLYVYMTFSPRTDHQLMDLQTPWGWVSVSSFWRKGTGQWDFCFCFCF